MDCGCNSFEKYASSNLYSFLLFRSVARWRSMAAEKAVTNFKVHFQHLLAVMKMIATVSRHNSFTNGSQVKLIWMCSIQSYPSSCKHRASIDWSHRSKPLPRSKKKKQRSMPWNHLTNICNQFKFQTLNWKKNFFSNSRIWFDFDSCWSHVAVKVQHY